MLTKPCNYNSNPLYMLDSLAISTILGIHHYERKTPQKLIFSVNAKLYPKLSKPDNLDLMLTQIINNYCQEHQPQLLEKIAYDVASRILENIPLIVRLSLIIKKPEALKHALYSYVSIDMTRPGEF